MTTPGVPNTSSTMRLMVDPPGFAIGWQVPVTVPNPAAGAAWFRKTDGNYFERLIAVAFTLTTSAVVANRVTALQLLDNNGRVLLVVPCGGAQVASTGLVVSLVRDAPAFAGAIAGNSIGFLPDILTAPDYRWQVVTSGIDAGDQFSAITLLVEQFPNDAAMISAID
jgi:hypothetical protein